MQIGTGTAGYFIYSISTDWISIQHRSGDGPSIVFFDDQVLIARGNTPDPIPNSAVKALGAGWSPFSRFISGRGGGATHGQEIWNFRKDDNTKHGREDQIGSRT